MDATKENAGIPNDKANAEDKQPPDLIKEAELLRIQSEIARNEAETRKFNSEAKDVEGKHSKGKTDTILKAVIGGMVLAGLLAAWFISYMQPILEKDQKLREVENRLHERLNEEKDLKLKDDSVALNALKQTYEKDQITYKRDQIAYNKNLEIFKAQNDSMKVQQGLLIKEYEKRIKNQGVQASVETKRLKDELNKLKAEQEKTEIRAVDLNDKLISNWLIENDWNASINLKGKNLGNFKWKFNSNGKVNSETDLRWDNPWEFKDGKLTFKIDNRNIYKAEIYKIENSIVGYFVVLQNGETGTWKMTKENTKEKDQIINDYCRLKDRYDGWRLFDPTQDDEPGPYKVVEEIMEEYKNQIDSMETVHPWLKTLKIDCAGK